MLSERLGHLRVGMYFTQTAVVMCLYVVGTLVSSVAQGVIWAWPVALVPGLAIFWLAYRPSASLDGDELVVRNHFTTHRFSAGTCHVELDRYRLVVGSAGTSRPVPVRGVHLQHDLIYYTKPARRRVLRFLALLSGTGFDVRVRGQPGWATKSALDAGLVVDGDR